MRTSVHLLEHILAHAGAVIYRDVRVPRLQCPGVPLMVPAAGKVKKVMIQQLYALDIQRARIA